MSAHFDAFPGRIVFGWDPPLTNASFQHVRLMTHSVFNGFCFVELIGLEGRSGEAGSTTGIGATFKCVFEQTLGTQVSGSLTDSYCRFSQSVADSTT